MCPMGTIGYAIRPGDTLWLIARRFNTNIRTLTILNPRINPTRLQIGQIICVPQTTTPRR